MQSNKCFLMWFIILFFTLMAGGLVQVDSVSATERVPTNDSLESDIEIDGDFSDWSNESGGREVCKLDDGGAKDTFHFYQYEYENGAPIERRAYFYDVNKHCVDTNGEDTLYILQAMYREFLTPYDWDMYEYQTVCTLINTDPQSNENYDYALCHRSFYLWCDDNSSACSQNEQSIQLSLRKCEDTSNTQCMGSRTIKSYPSQSSKNGVGREITFWVWSGGQPQVGYLISFFDDMTELKIPFSDINVSASSPVCLNTVTIRHLSETNIRDRVHSGSTDFCFLLSDPSNIIVPTAVSMGAVSTSAATTNTHLIAMLLLVTMAAIVTVKSTSSPN